MYNKSDKDLLSLDNVTSQEVQEIEAYLERFLGIKDEPVKGEYGRKVEVQEAEDSARRHRRDFADPFFAGIYTSREGEVLDLNGEELKIVNLVQYDWNDGNSDKYFQLINPDKEERLLYLEQNQALLNAFQEKPLEIFETGMPTFRTEKPPPMIQVAGKDYFLGHYKTGKCFITGVSTFIEVEQWQYHSKDKKSYIRVMNNQGLISFFQGEKRNQADFQDALDLDDRPLRDLETREPGWREEDLV
ncbi:MAG: DUF4178 domain-containing protein [Saprospirales bacterium]|nr:DUF4178 domain-containing protein [Saprospirales bacterium]